MPPVHFDAGCPGEEVLQRVGSVCLRHLTLNEAAARARDPEGIHQMRVAVRRLRAIIATFGSMLPLAERIKATAELRWFADALGDARDLDVFVAGLIASAPASLSGATEFERLVRAIEHKRLTAHDSALEAITSNRYKASVRVMSDWFDSREWRGYGEAEALTRPIGDLAPVLLERRFRQVKKRAKKFRTQSEAERHELRIAIKKLRYAADSLTSIYIAERTGSFIRRLKELQDDLGVMNDLSVARAIVASMVDPVAPNVGIGNAGRRLLAWHGRRLAAREPKIREHLRRLLASDRPWLATGSTDAGITSTEWRDDAPIQNEATGAAVGTDGLGIAAVAQRYRPQSTAPDA